jgi:hypothetical protein
MDMQLYNFPSSADSTIQNVNKDTVYILGEFLLVLGRHYLPDWHHGWEVIGTNHSAILSGKKKSKNVWQHKLDGAGSGAGKLQFQQNEKRNNSVWAFTQEGFKSQHFQGSTENSQPHIPYRCRIEIQNDRISGLLWTPQNWSTWNRSKTTKLSLQLKELFKLSPYSKLQLHHV